MTKSVYFVRHGECQANVDGVIAGGQDDSPLTEKGSEQAKETARTLSGIEFDLIVSSPMSRAHDTAKIIALELGVNEGNIVVRPEFTEKDVGEFSGKAKTEYFEFERSGGEAGEHTNDMQARLNKGLDWLRLQRAKNILVVTHNGTVRMARTVLENLPAKEFSSIAQLENGKFYKVELEEDKQ